VKRCPRHGPSCAAAGDGELNELVRSASLLNPRDLHETIYLGYLRLSTTYQAGMAARGSVSVTACGPDPTGAGDGTALNENS
jgi:hypothetical protein